VNQYIRARRMQRARYLGADTACAAGDQHDPIAQRKIVRDEGHAPQRYLKICGGAQ